MSLRKRDLVLPSGCNSTCKRNGSEKNRKDQATFTHVGRQGLNVQHPVSWITRKTQRVLKPGADVTAQKREAKVRLDELLDGEALGSLRTTRSSLRSAGSRHHLPLYQRQGPRVQSDDDMLSLQSGDGNSV